MKQVFPLQGSLRTRSKQSELHNLRLRTIHKVPAQPHGYGSAHTHMPLHRATFYNTLQHLQHFATRIYELLSPNILAETLPPALEKLRFYTDDYPRASLSVLSTFLILSTLLDLIFDPLLAAWTDSLRTVFGRDWGRRRPFLFVAAFLVTLSYAMAFSPPASFSAAAQEESVAWFAANGQDAANAPVFNSVASAVWYGIFHIAVKVFSDAIFEIPHGALLVELTHDGKERTSLWSWREIFVCLGILAGMVVPIIGESECSSSPDTGCYTYLLLSIVFGLIFTLSTLFLCWDVKERPSSDVPGQVESLVPSLVGCFSNFPFMILLVSDLVEACTGLSHDIQRCVIMYAYSILK